MPRGKNKKSANDTPDICAHGECCFKISIANEVLLNAIVKYAQMLDFVCNSEADEQLNIDGVINSVLEEGLERRVKVLMARHGIKKREDFLCAMEESDDGYSASANLKAYEMDCYHEMHDEILSHIPIEDRQTSLFDRVNEQA